jgi:outer membrane protein assembly factor BamB
MMPMRRACSVVLAGAFAVAGLAGCSGSSPQVSMCGPPATSPPAAYGYALDVTTAGRVRWQVPLDAPGSSLQLSPLAVGAVAVFAQADVLYGVRLADGHRLWSRTTSPDIAGMWRWQNLVVVLSQPGQSTQPGWTGLPLPVLTGLDASTGRARWTLRIGEGMGGFYPTADGGLVIGRGWGVLEVVDMSSGQVRWTRSTQPLPGGPAGPEDASMAAADGAVLIAVNGQLTSYDDRTGQVRWADALMPVQLVSGGVDLGGLQASAGLVYVTGAQQGVGGQSTPVLLGVSAADGRVEWRLVPSPPGSPDVYASGLMSVTSSSGGPWQDELDPAVGRVRWQVASAYQAIATPVGIITGSGPDGTGQISVRDTLTGQTRWTAALTGGWQPPDVGPGQVSPALPVFPAGPLLIVPATGPDLLTARRMSDGHRAWQVTIPDPVAAPPSAAPGGILVYAAPILGC